MISASLLLFSWRPSHDQVRDITEEAAPHLARAQDQMIKQVLHGAFVPQKEGNHETHL